jgi:hypothetical protein
VRPPDEQHADAIDDSDQQQFNYDGVAEPHCRRGRRVEFPARFIRHQAAPHKRPNHQAHPLVDNQLCDHEQREREQESRMHIHVHEERQPNTLAPRVALNDRQDQQWQPRKKREDNDPTPYQLQHIAREACPPQQLIKRSAEDE